MAHHTDIGGRWPATRILAGLVESNPDAILLFDPSGGLSYHNRAALEMARAAGCDQVIAFLPSELAPLIDQCRTGSEVGCLEGVWGSRTFSWRVFPIPGEDCSACVVTDMSRQSKLESQLNKVQQSMVIERSQAGLARDLNNILTVVQGQSRLLLCQADLTASTEGALRSISVAAQSACKLVRRLQRLEPAVSADPVLLDLNQLLTGLSPTLTGVLREDVALQLHYARNLPPILASPDQIEQIVLVLALNARDAMPRGGQVTFQTERVEIDRQYSDQAPARRPGTFVCFSCSDTGCGMDETVQSKLFKDCFTTKKDGKGLGLVVTQQIVNKLGGWMEVRTQPGEGATFKMFLPCHEMGLGSALGRSRFGGSETVLVVEDEPAVRLTIRHILERSGYQVLEAATSVEALAVWHRHHPEISLLLTDMVLPSGLTGEELAETFQAQKAGLQVIYASGYSKDVACRDAGGSAAFLEKPFEPEELLRLVREVLDPPERRSLE